MNNNSLCNPTHCNTGCKQASTQPNADQGARCDLHIHSKYSDRPSEWFLRRIGAPESFMEPAEIYRRCREQGMDYVTISDHNCIRGALEIADLPGVFISSELTTYFPEDRCKIHCLVSGITAGQFDDMQAIRENIYELREYMIQNRIIHTIAHPLFRVNDRLTPDHVEKLLVLFNRFEGINGSRVPRACNVANAIFSAMDANTIAQLADKHSLTPCGETPWVKVFTGGSDDHGGLYAAQAYTCTPDAATVFDYLEHLRNGRHEPGGGGGSSLQLASSLVHIAQAYLKSRLGGQGGDNHLMAMLLRNLSGESSKKQEPSNAPRRAIKRLLSPLVKRHRLKQFSETERLLIEDFMAIARQNSDERKETLTQDDRFDMVARLAHQLTFLFMNRCIQKMKKGDLMGSIQSFSSMGPVFLGIMPYLAAFSTQHKDNAFLRELCERYPAGKPVLSGRGGKAWITDTFYEVNGVAKTIHKLAGLSHAEGRPITVLTSIEKAGSCDFPAVNFPPQGMFSLPEYPELQLSLPPVLDIIRHIEECDYDSLIISTPGPMGLTGLLAARLLNLPVRGIYHTDFPHYVENWTDDSSMGELAKQMMRWFYRNMETIYAPTRAYAQILEEMGFRPDQLAVLPRGVDLNDFNPSFKKADFWQSHGIVDAGFTFVYVGRVSAEKNIEILLEAHRQLVDEGLDVALAVVGDGPERKRLQNIYEAKGRVVFTGYLHGNDLATAYASSHALAFPSMSDTFGNVVLEAHASGIPAIVSNQGGPQEIVQAHDSGLIADAREAHNFANAMRTLATDKDAYQSYCEAAFKSAQAARWEAVLELL
jgi:glycosyltransferase involved in cell wall biosynthesis